MSKYKRLHILTEGTTERNFANAVLATHLWAFGVETVGHNILSKRDGNREYRGGVPSFQKFENHLRKLMKHNHQPEARFSTMLDLYRLPNDFPALDEAQKCHDPYQKVEILENALGLHIADERFIPYFQLHEFEALVFANLDLMADEFFTRKTEVAELKKQLATAGNNPELVNDRPEKAPSKRIQALIPAYHKVKSSAILLKRSSIPHLKSRCPHFNSWLTKLENL